MCDTQSVYFSVLILLHIVDLQFIYLTYMSSTILSHISLTLKLSFKLKHSIKEIRNRRIVSCNYIFWTERSTSFSWVYIYTVSTKNL